MLKEKVEGGQRGWIQSEIWIGGGSGSLIQRLEMEEDQGAEKMQNHPLEILPLHKHCPSNLVCSKSLGHTKTESDLRKTMKHSSLPSSHSAFEIKSYNQCGIEKLNKKSTDLYILRNRREQAWIFQEILARFLLHFAQSLGNECHVPLRIAR